MPSPIIQAIKQISQEKGLSPEAVLETIEAALAAAFRKDFGKKNQNVKVKFDPDTGAIRAFDVKAVVSDEFVAEALKKEEEARLAAEAVAVAIASGNPPPVVSSQQVAVVAPSGVGVQPQAGNGELLSATAEPTPELVYNPKLHLSLTEARAIKPDATLGEELNIELEVPGAFGRMAAMTAKQVITQRLREAERSLVFNEYKSKERELITGMVQRRDGAMVFVDIGRIAGIMLPEDQLPNEEYRPGERIKVYVTSVKLTSKGPEVLISRTHPEIIRKLFTMEIPEVSSGVVQIHSIAREAGSRSKVSVSSTQENVDPIGASIGQRGSRIQTIIAELGGEKVDIIEHSDDQETFITHAISPAKVVRVTLHPDEKLAVVEVPTDQLSLAIGKGGQNVRLAARLTGWRINVTGAAASEASAETVASSDETPPTATPTDQPPVPSP